MATVWIADSAAYFAGSAYGRHKLAPAISPGKTWEGVLGAWIAVTLYGLILCWAKGLNLWWVVGLWGITLLSIMGDLFESLLKRQAGLKDSGSILPGHGGVLDRIDGLLPALPVAAFAFHLPLYLDLLHG
jgi:phosphatidate cytidylyltransferase